MSIPDYQSLMLPLLRIAADGPTRVPKAADRIADDIGLGQKEREELLDSGRQRVLHNRIHWAKFYMSKAGLIDSPARGLFVASEAGRSLLSAKPVSINVETLKRYPAFVDFYLQKPSDGGRANAFLRSEATTASATPEEQIEAANSVLNSALKAELLDRLAGQRPAFFERVIIDLLVAMGYGGSHEAAAIQLGKTGDGGVDGVIDEDRLGLDRIYLQAKRYSPAVGVGRPEIQSFVGSLVGLGATKGVFVTTSNFSKLAVEYVRHLPQRVILIDGKRLAELMVEYGVGVRTAQTVVLKRVDEDFFVDA